MVYKDRYIWKNKETGRNYVSHFSLCANTIELTSYLRVLDHFGQPLEVRKCTGLRDASAKSKTLYEKDIVEFKGEEYLIYWEPNLAQFRLYPVYLYNPKEDNGNGLSLSFGKRIQAGMNLRFTRAYGVDSQLNSSHVGLKHGGLDDI